MVEKPKIHAGIIEVAVAKLINYRIHTIVPNVYWGLGFFHECDMLVLDDKGRFTEIEIKCSLTDLRNDFKKTHGHRSKIISRLIYAAPEFVLEKGRDLIPDKCGIIKIVSTKNVYHQWQHKAVWDRKCIHDKTKDKPDAKTVLKFMSLGCMRIWSLKERNNKYSK